LKPLVLPSATWHVQDSPPFHAKCAAATQSSSPRETVFAPPLCQLWKKTREGASHHRRAGISSLIHTAGMRGHERGLQFFLLGYVSKRLGIFQERKKERKEDAERRVKNRES